MSTEIVDIDIGIGSGIGIDFVRIAAGGKFVQSDFLIARHPARPQRKGRGIRSASR